jgi:hypothetical protein
MMTALGAQAQDVGSVETVFGLGYQGLLAGSFVQGVSARMWTGDLMVEANIGYGTIGVETSGSSWSDSSDATLMMTELKAAYALVVNPHSRFYVGMSASYTDLTLESKYNDSWDSWSSEESINGYMIRPLFGVEYYFTEMPELGFNFEVGYNLTSWEVDDDDTDVDVKLDGVAVSLGAHYYF